MEKLTYEGKNQKTIELFMLVVYSIYNVNIVVNYAKMNSVVSYISMGIMAVCWVFYIGKYKTYAFRACFSALMVQISIVFFAIRTETVTQAVPVFMLFVVMLGLYGIEKLIYIPVITGIGIYIYHGFIINSSGLITAKETASYFGPLGNLLLLEYVVYTWTKRNRLGSQQLLKVIRDLKDAENSRDDFLANVSHEIRTPINTICGMSELILKEELSYDIKDKVMDIQVAGRNLTSAVGDILDFSELQSGRMELEEEAYNITSTINDVINMTLAKKNEKKIELIVDCDASIPSALFGDEKKLRRVILNLVDNAIKFTEAGCVCIVIGYRRESYGINLVVTVKDTGIGMDELGLEKIFTSFNQVDSSRRRQEGGLGLGLAISYALVQKMGGIISVKSKPGKGTSVQFVVPQKVLEDAPIVSVADRENINVACYIDMEQFAMGEIRDEYSNMIRHMVRQLKAKCHVCRNMAELQRRYENEHFTHVFTSIMEYINNTEYFDALATKTNVIIILDDRDEKYVTNPNLHKIYKPFYILSIVSALNGLYRTHNEKIPNAMGKFVTEDVHIMVVDDNRMNIRVIEGLLADYRIKVTTANSGEEALEKVVAAKYDFIFMDHMMPDMDGVETMKRIRHKVGIYFQKVPIIALTANTVAGTRENLISQGFNDFLEKPVERSVLERILKRNLPMEKIIYKTVDEPEGEAKTPLSQPVVFRNGFGGDEQLQSLSSEGLDVKQGIVYCSGKERYISVLKGYCEEWDDSGALAEELFEKQDWKNYTIAVHGMKSAMRSIGAHRVSELAAALEHAGKEAEIDYIIEHHEELIKEYRKLFEALKKYEWLIPSKKNEETVEQEELSELADERFDEILEQMEEAMYELDEERLTELVDELAGYKYHNTPLKTAVIPVKRKIEMSDCISAVELVNKLKGKIAGKEG